MNWSPQRARQVTKLDGGEEDYAVDGNVNDGEWSSQKMQRDMSGNELKKKITIYD